MPLYDTKNYYKNKNTTFVTGAGNSIQTTTKLISTKGAPKPLNHGSNDANNVNVNARAAKQTSLFHEPTETFLFGKKDTWKNTNKSILQDNDEDILSSQIDEQEQETQEENFKTYLQSHQNDNLDSGLHSG
jgi:hypothetical protein